ncbi:MAG TPA: urea ABC transporter permease subunit UrtB [Nitrospirales bacterium]|nr:urea ABC transporter permease subunit UrtB [Nitrospirales bacterium]HIO21416.1 urea ABC transporter permease subunit UrtB [Nitrospirales bacterium]
MVGVRTVGFRTFFTLCVMLIALFPLAGFAQIPVHTDPNNPPPPSIHSNISDLASDDLAVQKDAIIALAKTGDPQALSILEEYRIGSLYVWTRPDSQRVLVIGGDETTQDGEAIIPLFTPYGRTDILQEDGSTLYVSVDEVEEVRVNRRLRRVVKKQIDSLGNQINLADPSSNVRRAAAMDFGLRGDPAALPLLEARLPIEQNTWAHMAIESAINLINLEDENPAVRVAAATRLGELRGEDAVPALLQILDGSEDDGIEPDSDENVRVAAAAAIKRIEGWAFYARTAQTIFRGLSLSSILLLMALGLAIVFGLMGVINMAHGELMMIGAYSTFVVQQLFLAYFPTSAFDYYFIVALPVAFLVAGGFGLVIERGVIRFLYGRPLETLLVTWGLGLILQQAVRQTFGAANVSVSAPSWLSGGVQILVGVFIPYNRLFIIGLTIVCVITTYLFLFRTNTGLKIRAVTQNRGMSACLGIRTGRIDAMTFALGAGIAGLAGAALSQVGNVGPDLGQNYIVDSFMVVVTGGVGKLSGTVAAALGIGGLNKFLEPMFGAVYGKVLILGMVILFLQWRPSGFFPAKGRGLETS